jgi:hypothetical protein
VIATSKDLVPGVLSANCMIVPGQMVDMPPDSAPSSASGLSLLSPVASIDGDRSGPDGSPLSSQSGIFLIFSYIIYIYIYI